MHAVGTEGFIIERNGQLRCISLMMMLQNIIDYRAPNLTNFHTLALQATMPKVSSKKTVNDFISLMLSTKTR